MQYAMCMLHRRASACCIGVALHRRHTSLCMLHQHVASMRVASARIAHCIGARCVLHRCGLRVASARVGVLHRRTWRVASVCVACYISSRCIGARCIGDAQPSRSAFVVRCVVGALRVCAARLDDGRALAVAERWRDALVCRFRAACSP